MSTHIDVKIYANVDKYNHTQVTAHVRDTRKLLKPEETVFVCFALVAEKYCQV